MVREEHTHLAVTAAVAAGRADARLGGLTARASDLDFIPVKSEPYDLGLRTSSIDDPRLAPLWVLLDDSGFRQAAKPPEIAATRTKCRS